MKLLLAILLACFAAVASSLGGNPEPITVVFTVRAEGWVFTAYPDGSIHGQFGSNLGDAIRLPPGTADFSEIVALVKAAKASSGGAAVGAAVLHKDEVSVKLKPVEDNGYFRKLFLKHRDGWLDGMEAAATNERLVRLMQQIEYYKQPNKEVDSTR